MKDVKPIRSAKDHKAALAEIERLWDAKAGTPDGDRLEVLGVLVDAYEQEHFPIPAPDPVTAIEFRLAQSGLDRSALGPIIGTRGRISEILARKRSLTLAMIRHLAAEPFRIPAEVLIVAAEKKRPRVAYKKAAAKRAKRAVV